MEHKEKEWVDFVVTARKYKTTLTAKYKNRKVWQRPFVGGRSRAGGESRPVAVDPPSNEDV